MLVRATPICPAVARPCDATLEVADLGVSIGRQNLAALGNKGRNELHVVLLVEIAGYLLLRRHHGEIHRCD